MMTMWLASWIAGAHGADLVPEYGVEPITYKIEVHLIKPMEAAQTTGFKKVYAEMYGGILVCEPLTKTVDNCRMRNAEFWWGYQSTAASEPTLFRVPIEATFELSHNKRGHVTRIDVRGGAEPLWNAMVSMRGKLHESGRGWVSSEDARRRWGQELADQLGRIFAGPLDLERPKKGITNDGTWLVRELPIVNRRYASTGGTAGLKVAVGETTDDLIAIGFEGDVSVAVTNNAGALYDRPLTQKMQGTANIRRRDGRIVASEIWTALTSTPFAHDFTVSRSRAILWNEADSAAPGPAPTP